MADILISKGRHRAIVVPQTEKGSDWITRHTTIGTSDVGLIINVEYADEFAEDLKKEGLDVNIR